MNEANRGKHGDHSGSLMRHHLGVNQARILRERNSNDESDPSGKIIKLIMYAHQYGVSSLDESLTSVGW